MITVQLSTAEFLDLYTIANDTLRFKLQTALTSAMVNNAAYAGNAFSNSEDDTFVTVRAYSFGSDKIGLIKIIREYTKMGLKDAKDCAEGKDWAMRKGDAKRMITQILNTAKGADVVIL